MSTEVEQRYGWLIERVRAGTFDERAVEEGFNERFRQAVPAARVVEVMQSVAQMVTEPPVSTAVRGRQLELTYADVVATAIVEHHPPFRFTGLVFRRPTQTLDDRRLEDPPWTAEGDVSGIEAALRHQFRQQGMVGVVAAGSRDDGRTVNWAVGAGYADIDAGEAIGPDQPMLCGSITKLLTATVALQLVADGVIGVDDRANTHLRASRVDSDAVTIHQLLTHTSGVSSNFEHFVENVPQSPRDVIGDVVPLDFEPGSRREYSNGGYAVLGEVLADASGQPYAELVGDRIFAPLGMSSSSFATRWPEGVGPGYNEIVDGRPVAVARKVPSVHAPGGLVSTTRDLLRFIAGWRSLLPEKLADAALAPHVGREGPGEHQGYGWLVSDKGGRLIAGHAGGVLGFHSSLLWFPNDGRCGVLLTNRTINAESANLALLETMS